MKRMLILGSTGLVGNALCNEFKNDYYVYGTYKSGKINDDNKYKVDLKDSEGLKELLNEIKPDIIISSIRGNYREQIEFHSISANYIQENGGKYYFISTANVFDNLKDRPHYEIDIPKSETKYGKFKIDCERELKNILGDKLTIFRLPIVWGETSPRMKDLKDSLENGKKIIVYNNLFINNTLDISLAKQIRYVVDNKYTGIFHICNDDLIAHSEFIMKLVESLGYKDVDYSVEQLEKVDEYNFGLLSCRKEIPEELKPTNEEIIEMLSGK
ncbi:sugar nucleotide-binding protein [Helicovermis profundi]|uniref:dTDP-4-dehydrorhamnose reductase n=1 Tax=Helicovermis profundi TaxID=3065157 RepID=A0AAU9E4L1_9FIRM|nr:SDR family oxidoreductase [Clostridia bacterium S502]